MSMTVSIRIGAVRSGAYKGQRAHDLRQGKVPEYVDQTRSDQNRGDNVPTLARVHEMNEDQKHAARTAAQARYEAAQLGVGRFDSLLAGTSGRLWVFDSEARRVLAEIRQHEFVDGVKMKELGFLIAHPPIIKNPPFLWKGGRQFNRYLGRVIQTE